MKNKLKYQPSANEYMSLREELIQRINNINSQASSAIVTIISAWVAGFTLWISMFSDEIYEGDLIFKTNMKFFAAIIFIIPIYFFIPLAVKSGENLVQIASISTYIRVFYEYSSKRHTKQLNWESANNLLSNVNIDRGKNSSKMKYFNAEYIILSICSFFIYIFFSVLSFGEIRSNLIKGYISVAFFVVHVLISILLSAVSIRAIYLIYKSSSVKFTLMSATERYTKEYIEIAYERKIFGKKECLEAYEMLNPKRKLKEYYGEI